MSEQINVLVADDHPVFLEGLCTVLGLKDRTIKVVATAKNGEEAIEAERQHSPDLVLLDIVMPKVNGVAAARAIRKRNPDAKIIMLTTFDDMDLIQEALNAGAKGYILKDTPVDEIIQAIGVVLSGGLLFSPPVAEKLSLRSTARPALSGPSAAEIELKERYGMTEREIDIYKLMLKGLDNAEISELLAISPKTIRNHISNIYDILNVHNRTAAVLWGIERGLHID